MNEPSSLSVPLSPWAELASELPSRIARSLVMSRLEEISFGKLTLIEDGVSHVFGPGGAGPHATVQMHHPDAWTAIALGGSLGAGETYMDGLWS
ncbi:MAG: hypothetical protein WBN70_07060, partial [Polyangiales bacterium]